MDPIKISYTEDLEDVLREMEQDGSYVAFELLWMGEEDATYHNGLKISNVDISDKKENFDVLIDGKYQSMPIRNFIKYYFKNIFPDFEIKKFLYDYEEKLGGEISPSQVKPIKVSDFQYNPKDVRSTFLSLTTKTYPHGHEREVLNFLPDLKRDQVGNYYTIIGDNPKPETMFTSHLDTADRKQVTTNLYSVRAKLNTVRNLVPDESGDEYIITDGSSVLGADDKAGVAIMLYMMENNVPGLYYFFIGEERGGIGSNALSKIFDRVDYLSNVKRCVSFDRRLYNSVITEQLGTVCCSNEFATALCKEYNSLGMNLSMDPTGIYTDSASFIDDIAECTNISVGYLNEHTGSENQNMTFLEKIAKASISVNWDSLPTKRKAGFDPEITKKYGGLISELKTVSQDIEIKVVRERYFGYSLRVDLEDTTIDTAYEGLNYVLELIEKYKLGQKVSFDDTYLKIYLN
jgi:hypothetical protein